MSEISAILAQLKLSARDEADFANARKELAGFACASWDHIHFGFGLRNCFVGCAGREEVARYSQLLRARGVEADTLLKLDDDVVEPARDKPPQQAILLEQIKEEAVAGKTELGQVS